MARSYELDILKSREQDAFVRKQEAWQKYADARDRASSAHDEMDSAWQERCSTREEMNREYEAMQSSSDHYRETWDEYGRTRDYNNSRIEALRAEADHEHQEMIRCFDQASFEYESGDKSMAPVYAEEGREHKERRDELNTEVSTLIQEIRDAKTNAEWRAPKTDASAFRRAREAFMGAKSHHEAAQAKFKRLKDERDRLKAEFDSVQAEHEHLKKAFQQKLEEVKTQNQRERDRALDQAGVRYSERKDAKIVKKPDGTTQIYHGGLGKGDGYGHGHTALDQFGNKTYDRDAFAEHGHQNFTNDGANTCKTLAVGTDMFDGRPAKVRHRKDGRTDIFFTDSGNYGDGLGHGHIVLDRDGSTIYMRDRWQDKSQGQYLIDESKEDHTKI